LLCVTLDLIFKVQKLNLLTLLNAQHSVFVPFHNLEVCEDVFFNEFWSRTIYDKPIFFHLLFLHIYSVIYIFIVKSLIGHIDLMFQACKGFCSVYSTRISSVPVAEVPSLLSSRTKPFEIDRGTWGRMKNGNYKGDLAQVQYI
jgi:hypothetical protein